MKMNISAGKILLTVPELKDQGGVASYYNAILPYISSGKVSLLEIGGSRNMGGFLHPVVDQLRFRLVVKRKKPILVHLNPSLGFKSFVRDGLFVWQVKRFGYPCLVFWHGWNKSFESIVERKYLAFFRKTFGQVDAFIVLASEFERKLRDWGVTAPIYRETTCVDEKLLDDVDIAAKWENFPHSRIKVLFLARLERAKGVFETVQAIKLLIDEKIPVSLTIAGDGDIRKELETYARSLALTPQQINFTGDIRGQKKASVFAAHHMYCFPTFYGEGLPTSVLEAMAFGMPVVTCPVGGLADMFEDEKMGVLVHGKSPEEIAAALEKLISDPDKMTEIGRYNAAYAQKNFLASVVAKRLMNIYASLPLCQ